MVQRLNKQEKIDLVKKSNLYLFEPFNKEIKIAMFNIFPFFSLKKRPES